MQRFCVSVRYVNLALSHLMSHPFSGLRSSMLQSTKRKNTSKWPVHCFFAFYDPHQHLLTAALTISIIRSRTHFTTILLKHTVMHSSSNTRLGPDSAYTSAEAHDVQQTYQVQLAALVCSGVSVTASIIAFYWFCRMDKLFRHRWVLHHPLCLTWLTRRKG